MHPRGRITHSVEAEERVQDSVGFSVDGGRSED